MASGKKLARYTTIGGVTYGPDDKLPADVAKQITNPKAWEADEDSPGEADASEAEGDNA